MPLKHKSAIAALFFGAALCFFYLKYVPLLPPFQAFLLPVCFAVTVLSASDMQRGTVGFLFFLPLINNWPYFFGLQETTPQAPALAVVFLFYVLGWRISKIVSSGEKAGDGPSPNPVETPLLAATALITISAVILLWKWTNFFPVASGGGFDLATNVNGVTTGGAVMSTVFHALSYLSGFAFFLILSREFEWKAGLRKALGALGAGLLLSILFGFYQHFLNPALGNTTFWARMGQINATFKDPNSFGVVLSMMGPVALGAFFCVRGGWRIVAGAVFGLGRLITPLIGTRSGFLGFGLALVWFAFQSLRSLSKKKRANPRHKL